VGSANGRNPISLIVPCHRVIAADGTLGGYGGGLDRKLWLLQFEAETLGRDAPEAWTSEAKARAAAPPFATPRRSR
jgi:methylated-DNA-[protein]-cysteine S-methyltransferase